MLFDLLQGYQISTNHLLDTGAVFVRSLLQLDHSEVENEYDDRELYEYSTKLQCKTSVEKDNSMKITRYILRNEGSWICVAIENPYGKIINFNDRTMFSFRLVISMPTA